MYKHKYVLLFWSGRFWHEIQTVSISMDIFVSVFCGKYLFSFVNETKTNIVHICFVAISLHFNSNSVPTKIESKILVGIFHRNLSCRQFEITNVWSLMAIRSAHTRDTKCSLLISIQLTLNFMCASFHMMSLVVSFMLVTRMSIKIYFSSFFIPLQ